MESLPSPSPENQDSPIDLLPPASLNLPLWRSLLSNLKQRLAPEHVEPMILTSKPVDVGLSLGDRVSLPWYRTVFTNIGEVISPETLPALELESQPVEVDELVSDQIQHGWWTSLLRNLADSVSPERLPPLHLTSAPVKPATDSTELVVPRWSALVATPKVAVTDGAKALPAVRMARLEAAPLPPAVSAGLTGGTGTAPVHELTEKAKQALRFAHLREAIWVSVAVLEAGFLLYWLFVRM